MVEGGMKCVKYLLFIFNVIFFLAGLGLIIVGAVVQTKFSTYFDFFGGQFSAAAILLIVVGVIVFIIGFFGCCGAYKENYCMTMTFAVLLGLVFLLEIAAGITAYLMRDKVNDLVSTKMDDSMVNFGKAEYKGVTTAWDTLQHDFKCCGVNNYTDWKGEGNLTENSVPDSCCKPDEATVDCGLGQILNPVKIFKDGCLDQFVQWVLDNIYIIAGVGIGLAFVQVFGIIVACCLAQSIKREYETV